MLTTDDRVMIDADLRRGWEDFRVLQGSPSIDILRYDVTGSSDYLVLEGSATLVPGLSGIDAAVFPRARKRKSVRGMIEYEEADMVFVLYDHEVYLSDFISYQNNKYEPIQVNYKASSGRCVVRAGKV